MAKRFSERPVAWLLLGLLAGVLLAGFWSAQPTYAVATDRMEQFAIATGPVTPGMEALYVLDFLTGQLQALIMQRQTGKFATQVVRNVAADFELSPRDKPQFLMVTGMADLSVGGQMPQSVLYVAELKSGQLMAYTFPFRGERVGGVQQTNFIPLDRYQFRR